MTTKELRKILSNIERAKIAGHEHYVCTVPKLLDVDFIEAKLRDLEIDYFIEDLNQEKFELNVNLKEEF